MESSSSNFNKNNTENANEITKNSILSSQTSKKKVLFQFPPLPNNKHEANTHSSHRKLKIDPKNMSDDTTEELKIEKLTRKQKKNESQNNLSLISAVLSQNTFISVNNFEFSKSLQENKIIDENPFEEFEDEDQKMINSSILEKLNSKFVLKNTQFTGNLDCPLKIEDEAPISLTYDERKRISICYVLKNQN